ncbi:unnamed protein product [Bursaphelenchus xylophilus]|uniref:(pine wood nematode) hypothetical protein n=1 Tax=Bursaphelenchus xylophilus TaxID=6326 RepID=A0A1I7SLX0_BURXY|nr:unnamed protein product [Bursaphelenchus xylophilus]CAG9129896.1 unnamed protein product [Bursaphelenchus xylophilus]
MAYEDDRLYTIRTNDGVISLPPTHYFQYLLRIKTNGRMIKRNSGTIYPGFDEWKELMEDMIEEERERLTECVKTTTDQINQLCTFLDKEFPCLKGTVFSRESGRPDHVYNVAQLAMLECLGWSNDQKRLMTYCCVTADCYRLCYDDN